MLPEGIGPPVVHTEKVYVPIKDHPEVGLGIREEGRGHWTVKYTGTQNSITKLSFSLAKELWVES